MRILFLPESTEGVAVGRYEKVAWTKSLRRPIGSSEHFVLFWGSFLS